jgi:hypothetical protein
MMSPPYQDAEELIAKRLHSDLPVADLSGEAWLHVRKALRLSEKELRIVQGIWLNRDQECIATGLRVSTDLVYRLTQRIFVKLHIGSTRELIWRVNSQRPESEAPRLAN